MSPARLGRATGVAELSPSAVSSGEKWRRDFHEVLGVDTGGVKVKASAEGAGMVEGGNTGAAMSLLASQRLAARGQQMGLRGGLGGSKRLSKLGV